MIHTRTLLCLEHCLRTYLRPQICHRSQNYYRTIKTCRVLHKNNAIFDEIEVFYPIKPNKRKAASAKKINAERHQPPQTNENKRKEMMPTSDPELDSEWISDMGLKNSIAFERYHHTSIHNVDNIDSEEVKNSSENIIKANCEPDELFDSEYENNHHFKFKFSKVEVNKSRKLTNNDTLYEQKTSVLNEGSVTLPAIDEFPEISNNDNAYEQKISLSNEGSEPLPTIDELSAINGTSETLPAINEPSELLPLEDYMPDDATTPANILGDLNSLFGSSEYQQVIEDDLMVEEQSEDYVPPNYAITFYPHEGESYVLDGFLEEVKEDHSLGIPLNHVIQYIRDNKGIDTAIIEIPDDVAYARYMIVTTIPNKRQVKHVGAGLSSMCKHEYNMVWQCPVQAELSDNWAAIDTGICVVHFMVPAARERMCLESLWLGLDKEEASLTEKEMYNKDLMEGLFPDEDFTKLAKPWELQYEED